MTTQRETISITIRSKRVPARSVLLTLPRFTQFGSSIACRRVVVYDYVLDGKDEKVLRGATALAKRTGARLTVSDLTREGWVGALLRRLTDRISVSWLITDLKEQFHPGTERSRGA